MGDMIRLTEALQTINLYSSLHALLSRVFSIIHFFTSNIPELVKGLCTEKTTYTLKINVIKLASKKQTRSQLLSIV